MKLSRREGTMVALCVVVVAVIGVPSVQQLRGSTRPKSVAELETEKERADKAAVRLQGEIEGLEKDVAALTWQEPPEALPPLLLKELHGAARRSGVSLASFRPGKVLPALAGSKLPIVIEIKAPFPRAAAFLAELRRSATRIALERVQVAATDANTDVVAVEMRLAAYLAQAPAPEKAPTSSRQPDARSESKN